MAGAALNGGGGGGGHLSRRVIGKLLLLNPSRQIVFVVWKT